MGYGMQGPQLRHRGLPDVRGHISVTSHHRRRTNVSCKRQVVPHAAVSTGTLTESVFAQMDSQNADISGGAGGATSFAAFMRADQAWYDLRNMKVRGDGRGCSWEGAAAGPPPSFVVTDPCYLSNKSTPTKSRSSTAGKSASPQASSSVTEWDVVVCGGTLGVFMAAALALRGLRVAVVERGALRGREQEWNVSRKELEEMTKCGLMTSEEIDSCISMEFNPVRVGFKGSEDVWTKDVLNCGVNPDALIQLMRRKLEVAGGKVLENTSLQGMTVHPDGVSLRLSSDINQTNTITSRLVLDCMGHASPLVKQIRWGRKPDGVCVVVGTLGSGFTNNTTADVIYTHTDLQPASARAGNVQLFWEAFPAGSGPTDRTTYMFTYMDASPWRPSMMDLFEEYWPLMESYQGVKLNDIRIKRALFGMFPTFRDSPLKPGFDRVLQIGDASGIQSPLSFGGFGALTRHVGRITGAVKEALDVNALDAQSLALINPYNPGLSSSWMLQKAMSVRQDGAPAPTLINRMLGGNFEAMQQLGDPVMKPFLQDVIQLGPLMTTLTKQMMQDPLFIPQLLLHLGPGPLADWLKHVSALALFTALHKVGRGPLSRLAASSYLQAKQRYAFNRWMEAFEVGSGLDYKL